VFDGLGEKDIPGLILESGSVDALIERVKIAALELSGKTAHNVGLNIKAARQGGS
jgi:hypothetical protein